MHAGSIIALVVVMLAAVLLGRTIMGFQIRLVGAAPRAARFSGFNADRLVLLTFAISGGLAGLAYSAFIATHMPRPGNPAYVAVREDWIWNVIVPGLAYGCLLIVGALVPYWPAPSLYVVAVLSLLMLFVGIHNAWDIAVWMTMSRRENKREDKREDK